MIGAASGFFTVIVCAPSVISSCEPTTLPLRSVSPSLPAVFWVSVSKTTPALRPFVCSAVSLNSTVCVSFACFAVNVVEPITPGTSALVSWFISLPLIVYSLPGTKPVISTESTIVAGLPATIS